MQATTSIHDNFHKTFMAPRIFWCMNLWTCSVSKERIWNKILLKVFWTKRLENQIFVKDNVWIGDQGRYEVDHFHQHPQSLHSPIPLLASTFHSVTLGCLVLFNVWWSRYFTHASVCICYRLFLLLRLSCKLFCYFKYFCGILIFTTRLLL